MSKDQFLVFETIKTAWHHTNGAKKTFWTLIGIVFLLVIVRGILAKMIHNEHVVFLFFILSMIQLLLSITRLILGWGGIYLGILRADGGAIRFAMVQKVFRLRFAVRMAFFVLLEGFLFLPLLILVLAGVESAHSTPSVEMPRWILLAGFAWFIVAIWLIMRMRITAGILIMEDASLWTAIKKSFRATRSRVLQLLGLYILNGLILFAGVATLGIGLIWVIPYLFINYGVVYRRLVF